MNPPAGPPTSAAPSDAESPLRAKLRLSLAAGVGPRIRQALLERFGSARGVFEAAPEQLRQVPGVGPKVAAAILDAGREADVEGALDECCKNGVTLVADDDQAYPRPLREIHDPPPILFVRGRLEPRDALAVGVVGMRHASPYGLRQAERLAYALASRGLTVISGLARGIDAAAHRGALRAGGRTIAVLASGVLNVYPPEHRELADEIASTGAVLSESPPHTAPLGGLFPQRNRIISGLSLGVLVVEAAAKSGSLITARHALEQDREVFAVPGPVDSRGSHGCHRLIRDGARLVETADDIFEELGPLAAPAPAASPEGAEVRHPGELQLGDVEKKVLAAVTGDPTPIDQIVAQTGLPTHQALAALSVLEMRRFVRRLSGAAVCRI